MLCFRGTSVYMAPEILIKSRRLDAASFENLKKVDVWAFGMVMFNLVNLNLKYPFQLDLVKESPLLDQLPDFLQQQNYPSESPKYAQQRETIWASIVALKKKCTSLDPASRPSASEISDKFTEILVKQTEDANGILLPRVEEWLVWFYRHIDVKKIPFNGQHIFSSTSVSYFIFMFIRENLCNLKHEKPLVVKKMHETSVCQR